MTSLFARVARRMALPHIRHLPTLAPPAATGLVAQVYDQVERDFGMIAPPVALHAPAPRALAASWLILRETLLSDGLVDRAAKEAVAAATSLGNRCPYCVEVHGTTLAGLLRDADALAIAEDRIDEVTDPRLRALARWARHTGDPRPGDPSPPVFPPEQGPELIGVAVTFHYFNRMVNVFLRRSPLPAVPGAVLGAVRGGAARVMGRLASAGHRPGASLDLLPPAPPAADLGWASGRTHVSDAMARACAAVDRLAEETVPEPVRRLVVAALDDPSGALPSGPTSAGTTPAGPIPSDAIPSGPMLSDAIPSGPMLSDAIPSGPIPAGPTSAGPIPAGMTPAGGGAPGRAWDVVPELLAELPDGQRPAARLALLTALASYRVTDAVVADFRAAGNDDRALVALASWASLAAARRIGVRLGRAPS